MSEVDVMTIVRRVAARLHRMQPDLEAAECNGWAQLGVTRAISTLNMSLIVRSNDPAVAISKWLTIKGRFLAVDEMRSAHVMLRPAQILRFVPSVSIDNIVGGDDHTTWHDVLSSPTGVEPFPSDRLHAIAAMLHGDARAVFVYRFVHGLNWTDIGRIMHRSKPIISGIYRSLALTLPKLINQLGVRE
jgi:hypothetical protein